MRLYEFRVGGALVKFGFFYGYPILCGCVGPRSAISVQWSNKSGITPQRHAVEQGSASRHHFQPSIIPGRDSGYIRVP